MTPPAPIYDRNRFPKQIAPRTCRGCHGPVTDPRRSTWCGKECHERFHPKMVEIALKKRDGHICQICGLDIRAVRLIWYREKPPRYPFDNWLAWRRREPKEEYDHIVPFSEGGL